MHGWRARIGLLVPAVNNTMERELWSIVPDGVTVATARIACERHGTAETLRGMEVEGKNACARVAMAEPGVVLFGCTSGSFYEGPAWNGAFEKKLAGYRRRAGGQHVRRHDRVLEAARHPKGGCRHALRGYDQ